MKHREQEVVINEVRSSTHTPVTRVPQGSVVGPLMFIMYTTPLYDIIISYGVSGMLYADDTQLYVSFKPDDRIMFIRFSVASLISRNGLMQMV